MSKITFAVVLGIAVVGATVRADERINYRDSMGRIQGTVTTDRYGKTTYRDYMGRIQGTEQTDRYGKTTISLRPSLTLRPCGTGVPQDPTLPSSPTASHQRATRQLPDRYSITRHSISSA